MKFPPQLRIAALGLPVLCVAGVIGWLVHVGGQRNAELREGLRILEEVDDAVVDLKSSLHRIDMAADGALWRGFADESRELERWLEAERPRLTTPREHELLDNVALAYAGFLANVDELVDQVERGELRRLSREQMAQLWDQLTDVRRRGASEFLADSHRYLESLRTITLILLAVLIAVAIGFSIAVYRGMISPMQAQLSETSAALKRSEKLASLGVLAAGVAHEIRNPLTAIKARLYTHQKLFPEGSAEQADAAFIGDEIRRLEGIVSEVLQFARPAEPRFSAVPPGELLEEVRALLAPQLTKAAIGLTVEVATDLPIHADRNQIKQVLINLVQNAAESIGDKGRIVLRARKGRGGARDRVSDTVVLEVEDSGKGIPPEVQERLFDPFFTTKPSGTGLGLSIAARMVEKHGGSLQFQTAPDRGTTFGLVLPVERSS